METKEDDVEFYEVCMKDGRAVKCGHKMTKEESDKWFRDLEVWIKNGKRR